MKTKAIINKDLFLATLSCPTYGWYLSHTPPKKASLHDHFLMEQGLEVQKKAHSLYPHGVLVEGNNLSCATQTEWLLKNPNIEIIFEATFMIYEGIAKADIIKREGEGWKLYEIKSGKNEKDDYIDDIAYTTMIASQAGLNITNCILLLLSPDYRIGMPVRDLFVEYDRTEEVLQRAKEFWTEYDNVLHTLQHRNKPHGQLKMQCRKCDYFDQCAGKGIDNHILTLPRLHHTKLCQLVDEGVLTINDIPDDFSLTHNQERVRQAIVSNEPYLDKERLAGALDSVKYPLYHLDFETVTTALPLYSEIGPYTQIPTQYSIHVVGGEGEILAHHEYLADPHRDCRRELAEHLIRHCDTQGSIIHYAPFEKTVIRRLKEWFPDLKEPLEALLGRLVDLCDIIINCYYHEDFRGKYSMKSVLPAMIPQLSYKDLEVGNGSDAIAVFANMANGKCDRREEKEWRQHLLDYCRLDTLAMVKVWEKLAGMARG